MENSVENIQSLIDSSKFEEAEAQARKLLADDQNNVEIKTTLARILAIEGKNADAVDLLKHIIEQDKENYYPLYLLAAVKENQEEFDDAIEYYKQALKLKPNNGRIFYQLGKIYNNYNYKGKNEYSALHNLREAITSEKPPAGAFLELASIESLSRSINILQKGLEKYPTDDDLNFRLCERLYSLEEYSKCIQVVDEAEKRGVKLDNLQYYKALSLYFLKQYKDASEVLEQITKGETQVVVHVKAFLGILLCEAQNYLGAETVLKNAITDDIRNSLDFTGHIILICCYFREGRIEGAEKVFKEIPNSANFGSQNYLFINSEILDIDTYLLEALNGLIASDTASSKKAGYLRAVHDYYSEANKEKKSSEVLEQTRKEFLSAIDLVGARDPENYRSLYQVSKDLKNWGDAAYYYFLSEIYEDSDEVYGYEFDVVLEAINRNQKNIEKLFSIIDQVLNEAGYLSDRFAKKCLSQLITFFYSKEKFEILIRFAKKFSYGDILKAEGVFEIAYACVKIGNKKQGKKYYKAYLNDIGESSAAANNLALLEEEDGNLAEAERLTQLAITLDPSDEKAKNNHTRIISRIRDEEEKKQAYQKAADLYRQETETSRFFAIKMYSLKTEDDLILVSYSKLANEANLTDDEIDLRIDEFLKKKYFNEIESKSILFDGRILRTNPAIVSLLENDLRKFEERDKLSSISNELLSDNLDIKFGYNQLLLEKLSSIKSPELADILGRDLYETIVALAIKSYKSSLILCGSIAESILLDAMLARKENALQALERILAKDDKSLKSDDKKLDRWVLDRLLDVALEMNLISENLYHWGHGLRGFRNLVHPGVEQRQSIEVSRENAEMAWNVVKRLLGEIKAKEEVE